MVTTPSLKLESERGFGPLVGPSTPHGLRRVTEATCPVFGSSVYPKRMYWCDAMSWTPFGTTSNPTVGAVLVSTISLLVSEKVAIGVVGSNHTRCGSSPKAWNTS